MGDPGGKADERSSSPKSDQRKVKPEAANGGLSLRCFWLWVAIITVGNLCVWLCLWRNVYIGADDFRASLNGGARPLGASTLLEVVDAARNDYLLWNGRISDALVKAEIAVAYRGWQVLSPLLLTALAFVTWWFVLRLREHLSSVRRNLESLFSYAGISMLPLAMVGSYWRLGPGMFFFNAAVVGYGTGLLFAIGALSAALGNRNKPASRFSCVAAAALGLPVALLNESIGLGLMLGAFLTALLPSFSKSRKPLFCLALASSVGFAVFWVSPGRQARGELVSTAQPLFKRVLGGLFSMLGTGGFLLLAALVSTVLVVTVAVNRHRGEPRWTVPVLGVVGAFSLGGASTLSVVSLSEGSPLAWVDAVGGKTAALALFALAAGLAGAAWVVVGAPSRLRDPLLLLLVVSTGAAAPSLYLGLWFGRPWTPALYFLLLAPWVGLEALKSQWSRRAALTAAMLVVIAFWGAGLANSAARLAELEETWGPVQQELFEYSSSGRTEGQIVLPASEAYPDQEWARLVPKVGGTKLKEWFGLPECVEIVVEGSD